MMKETDLARELKNGVPGGLYFFYGDEDYLKNRRAAEMKKAVLGDDPSSPAYAFGCFEFVFGDGEFDAGAVEDAMLAPPMMSPRKFVSLTFSSVDSLKTRGKAASDPDSPPTMDGSPDPAGSQGAADGGDFAGEDGGKPESRTKNRLLEYLKTVGDPGEDTVVVVKATADGFDPGTAKKPSAFLRDADRFMKCVEFPYQTDARLFRWMERHFAEYGLGAAPDVCPWILKTAGRSMYRLSGELAKTAAYAAARCEREHTPPAVTLEDAKACVAATEEDDAFGLADRMTNGDMAGALRILRIKMSLREDPLLILGQISRAFSDLYAAACFSADGRDVSDFAAAMKMHVYRAGLVFRAASKNPPERYADALALCLEADRRLKSGAAGSSGYAPIERLICALAAGTSGTAGTGAGPSQIPAAGTAGAGADSRGGNPGRGR
ncbi:MAG: hypothetical protein E7576_09525 [Ruminococcaceae bacterium]|jgi:DNA polymerase III delta subunit|nr:hypothetical protein [Oscillospiraceae bacterium]